MLLICWVYSKISKYVILILIEQDDLTCSNTLKENNESQPSTLNTENTRIDDHQKDQRELAIPTRLLDQTFRIKSTIILTAKILDLFSFGGVQVIHILKRLAIRCSKYELAIYRGVQTTIEFPYWWSLLLFMVNYLILTQIAEIACEYLPAILLKLSLAISLKNIIYSPSLLLTFPLLLCICNEIYELIEVSTFECQIMVSYAKISKSPQQQEICTFELREILHIISQLLQAVSEETMFQIFKELTPLLHELIIEVFGYLIKSVKYHIKKSQPISYMQSNHNDWITFNLRC